MSYLERMFVPTDDDFSYFSSVLAYVRLIKSQRKVMMTGHSLGGSVAQVVGAKEGLPAITYNAPGIVYSRRYVLPSCPLLRSFLSLSLSAPLASFFAFRFRFRSL
jgi:putative lipase involved disintegration of autophagic bodies